MKEKCKGCEIIAEIHWKPPGAKIKLNCEGEELQKCIDEHLAILRGPIGDRGIIGEKVIDVDSMLAKVPVDEGYVRELMGA